MTFFDSMVGLGVIIMFFYFIYIKLAKFYVLTINSHSQDCPTNSKNHFNHLLKRPRLAPPISTAKKVITPKTRVMKTLVKKPIFTRGMNQTGTIPKRRKNSNIGFCIYSNIYGDFFR